MPSDARTKCVWCGYTKAWHGRVDGAPNHEFEMPSDKDETVSNEKRSNHFDDAAIDKGTFPDHISRDGTAYYGDGTVLPSNHVRAPTDKVSELADGPTVDARGAAAELIRYIGSDFSLLLASQMRVEKVAAIIERYFSKLSDQ